jgi:GT2 family glycosyltransferase
MGGLDRSFPQNYNDVDFCFRVREAGYAILYEPLAVLRHDECSTRSAATGSWERQRFLERWGEQLNQSDCYYNPNMSTETEDGSLRLKDKDIPF